MTGHWWRDTAGRPRHVMWLMMVVCAGGLLIGPPVTWAAKRATTDDNEEIYKELELFEHALSIVRSD